ncbi:hypothetical protein [Mycolicibacterium septicum]|uniref:hypothetical protein n=1 Tax=Mycolicibacterium septicum TaxID=98668 RepID=UPI0013A53CE1|nr:hypothetical protein [Mycolicibacterium septicum]
MNAGYRMLDIPRSLPRTGCTSNPTALDADDLLLGSEPVRVPVKDVEIGHPVAPRRNDVRLIGSLDGLELGNADGGRELADELVVLHRNPRLRQRAK